MPRFPPGNGVCDLMQYSIPAFRFIVHESQSPGNGDELGIEPATAKASPGPVKLESPALLVQTERFQLLIGESSKGFEMPG